MADSITPAVEEMEKSLKSIDKVLTSSAKETFLLKQELLSINKVISTKNWEILSRFLSGTGAWRVLNKFKASILAMVQLASIEERAALAEAERMKKIAEVAKDRRDLAEMEAALHKVRMSGDEKSLEKLREMSDLFAGTELMGGKDKALEVITKRIAKQKGVMAGLLDAVTGKKKSIIPKFETLKATKARRMHMETLNSNKNHTLLMASGLGLNLQQLLKIAESTTAVAEITKRQEEYDAIFEDRLIKAMSKQAEEMRAWKQKKEDIEEGKYGSLAYELEPQPRNLSKELMGQKIAKEMESEGKIRPSIEDPKEIGKVQAILDQIKDHSKVYEMAGNITGKGLEKLDETLKGFYSMTENISFKPLEADWSNQEDVKETLMEGLNQVKDTIVDRGKRVDMWEKLKEKIITKPLKSVKEFAIKALNWAVKAAIYFTAIVLGLFLLYRTFKLLEPAWEEISTVLETVWWVLVGAFTLISEGLSDIKQGFLDGDFFQVLWGLVQIALGVWGGIVTLAMGALAILWGGIVSAIGRWAMRLLGDGEERTSAIKQLLYVVGGIIAAIGLFTVSWPLVLAGLFIAAIGGLVDKIGEYIFGYADGGVTKGGLVRVGERGEELVRLPRGSRVHSNAESKKMLANTGGNTTNITVQVQGSMGSSDAEIRRLADKLGREINLRMNRTGTAVNKFG